MRAKMKLAALLLTFSFFSANTFAQCKADNTFTEFGAYSSLGKNKIPDAWIDSVYDETLTIVIPTEIQGFAINQVTIKDVPNLYAGLSYLCKPSNCIFPGGANNCIQIKGLANDLKEANQKAITLKLFIETSIVSFDTIIEVEFNLFDSATLSIQTPKNESITVYPNPATDLISFDFGRHLYNTLSIELLDLNGELVKTFNFNSNEENVQVPTQDIENGLYIVKHQIDDKMLFNKITIQH
jgi:hypothetical protein